jgi:hypothetical protein
MTPERPIPKRLKVGDSSYLFLLFNQEIRR